MTPLAGLVLRGLSERIEAMPARKCETQGCSHDKCKPEPVSIDQTHQPLAGVRWACPCGWVREESL